MKQKAAGSGNEENRALRLAPIAGHEELRERIRRAATTGRMPQSLLFHGPQGIGKQRLALWTGQLLLCEPEGGPCGRCRSCRLAERLEHPDLHWHFPLPRPKDSHKLREKLEESRWEELDRRRRNPREPNPETKPTGIYLAAVEELRAQAARRPAMGKRSILVVGDAEQMVPQAANPEAANAFLKLLEEPPPHVSVILTSSRPGALLPTIRSRTLSVRVTPLELEEVQTFLRTEAGLSAGESARAARISQGSIGRALRIVGGFEEERRRLATDMLEAALSPRDSEPLRVAAKLAPRGARGEFTAALGTLTELLRDLLSLSVDRGEFAFEPEAVRSLLGPRQLASHQVTKALEQVEEALDAAAGNVNPQVITATLLTDLRRTLAVG